MGWKGRGSEEKRRPTREPSSGPRSCDHPVHRVKVSGDCLSLRPSRGSRLSSPGDRVGQRERWRGPSAWDGRGG